MPEHVRRIRQQVRRYVQCPHEFVCYSDTRFPLDGHIRPLRENWQGFWSKLEMFRDVERSFYIDLDMTIQADITDIVTDDSSFMALRNMNPRIQDMGSAMMLWRGDYRYIYDIYKSDPVRYMSENNKIGTPSWGDQSFIFKCLNGKTDYFQDRFPNRISCFRSPQKTDIKVFYGKETPWKKS